MCHALLRGASLYDQLLTFDHDLAAEARAAGCKVSRVAMLLAPFLGTAFFVVPERDRSRESQAVVKGGTTSRRFHLTWSGHASIEAVS